MIRLIDMVLMNRYLVLATDQGLFFSNVLTDPHPVQFNMPLPVNWTRVVFVEDELLRVSTAVNLSRAGQRR